jgi:hypothetical protein
MPGVFETDLRVVRHNRWLIPLEIAITMALVLVCRQFAFLKDVVPTVVITGAFVLGVGWYRSLDPRLVPAKARVDAERLVASDGTVVRKEEVRFGLVEPRASGGARVRLKRRGLARDRAFDVNDVQQGRRLLAALGLGANRSVARFSIAAPLDPARLAWASMACSVLVSALLGAWERWLPLGPLAFALVSLAPAAGRRSIEIGADAVVLSWLGRRQVIPHTSICGVSAYTRQAGFGTIAWGIALTLADGRIERVLIGAEKELATAIIERITEAMTPTSTRGETAMDADRLARAGRDTKAWLASARAVGVGADASIRRAEVPRERLLRIVEEPAAMASARAAAAVALDAGLDVEGRAHLRRIAEGIAAPKLRVAIERVAAGAPEEQVEAAMADLAEEELATT